MAKKKRREETFYDYTCTITTETYRTTRKAPNESELTSIPAYYQLHAEEDDRPDTILKQLGISKTATAPVTPEKEK